MFLAHFAHWSYSDIMEMPTHEIYYWHNEAVKLHKKIHDAKGS